ncbi:hypothetical protein GCM10017783_25090 [Deinococcus piscis]|uniref:Uncharacterized protein n=1 Tax=Deinococcus piscis TaxID=394230 RepID=A0ABQ3KBJ4_9DEIO|nr:hypothetical protein GCM10017783_25090 [Deinococcus piscis]
MYNVTAEHNPMDHALGSVLTMSPCPTMPLAVCLGALAHSAVANRQKKPGTPKHPLLICTQRVELGTLTALVWGLRFLGVPADVGEIRPA